MFRTYSLAAIAFILTISLAVSGSPAVAENTTPAQPTKASQNSETVFQHLTAGRNAEEALAPEIELGEPGLSYQYVKELGTLGEPYIADTIHINRPQGLYIDGSDHIYITEEFGERVLKYDATRANLLALGVPGICEGDERGFCNPRDIALDQGGNIWVVDPHRAVQYDQTGTFLQQFPITDSWQEGSSNDRFDDPHGIAFDSAGRLYVSDTLNQRIQVFDLTSGSPVYSSTIGHTNEISSTAGYFFGPMRIAIDDADQVYVTERGNQRVQKCIYSAGWACTILDSGLGSPRGITVDDSGNVFIADGWGSTRKCTSAGTCSNFGDGAYYWDLAVDSSGNLYGALPWKATVDLFNSAGIYQGEYLGAESIPYLTDANHFYQPRVAIDKDDNILILEEKGQRLVKLDPEGNLLWSFGVPGIDGDDDSHLSWPHSLATDLNGTIYVAGGCSVKIFSPLGAYLDSLGNGCGTGNDQFGWASGVDVDNNGNIYVADYENHRVMIYNSSKVYIGQIGATGVCSDASDRLCAPIAVETDAAGNIYVTDGANLRVQKFNNSRQWQMTIGDGTWGETFDQLSWPEDVAVDAQGRIFISDWTNNRVQVFDPAGKYLTTIGGAWGTTPGQLKAAPGVDVDSKGNVYVADWDNSRIQVFAPGVSNWKQININGFGDRNQGRVGSLASFNDQLYAASWVSSNGYSQVWRSSDGNSWTEFTPAWTSSATGGASVFNGKLYLGVAGDPTGEIWRTDGITWEQVVANGFGDADVYWVNDLAVFSGYLYAVTSDYDDNLQIYRSDTGDAGDWEPVEQDAFGGSYTIWQDKLFGVYDNHLYIGLTRDGVGELWRSANGLSWAPVYTNGLAANNTTVSGFEEFNGDLFIGIRNVVDGAQLWRSSNGLDFTPVITDGFGNSANSRPYGLKAFNGTLFLSISNWETGANIWKSTNGVEWMQIMEDGWGDSNTSAASYFDKGISVFDNTLIFSGWNDASGAKIWQYTPEYHIYLAIAVKNYQPSAASSWKNFTSPTTATLHAVDMVSETDGWAVGAGGTILHYSGSAWTTNTSPVTSDIKGIDMLDASSGWAVGSGGKLIRWNGSAWSSIASPTGSNLNDVESLAANDAWAAGDDGVLIHWNGSAWGTVTSPTTYDLFALDFVTASEGWAVGGEWNASLNWYEAVYLRWNGSAWTSYSPVTVLDLLFDVDMVSTNYGIAAGPNNAKSFWNGTTWNQSYTTPMMHYEGISLLAANDGWAVGWEFTGKNIQHWDGTAWSQVACPTTERLNDLHMHSTTQGWAVGDDGTILRYSP